MNQASAREEPRITAAAERQMRSHEMASEIEAHRAHETHEPYRMRHQVGPFIAISREAGAGGSEVGRILGQRLGWEVLDKNLVDRIAMHCHKPSSMMELVDETASSWITDVLGPWLDSAVVPHEQYVAKLTRIVMAAARRGNVVLVGRGAWFLLRRDAGLAVRLIAPLDFRIKRMMEIKHIGAAEARTYCEQTDHGRRVFVQRYFHHDIDDPHLYDLILNTGQMGVEGAAEQILMAMTARKLI
jgi:cytidylate kinase